MRERHDCVQGGIVSLCYAFGYFAAAMRGEIPPLLSLARVELWLRGRLTPEQMAAGILPRLTRSVYLRLARLACRREEEAGDPGAETG